MIEKIKKYVLNEKVLTTCLVLVVLGLVITKMSYTKSATNISFPDQTVESIQFSDATLEGNKLTIVVTNTLSTTYSLKTINVKILDSSSKEITTMKGYIGNTIESGSSKQLVVSTDVDLTNATSVTYTINK